MNGYAISNDSLTTTDASYKTVSGASTSRNGGRVQGAFALLRERGA